MGSHNDFPETCLKKLITYRISHFTSAVLLLFFWECTLFKNAAKQRRFLQLQDALVSSSLKLIDVVEDDIGATESNQ